VPAAAAPVTISHLLRAQAKEAKKGYDLGTGELSDGAIMSNEQYRRRRAAARAGLDGMGEGEFAPAAALDAGAEAEIERQFLEAVGRDATPTGSAAAAAASVAPRMVRTP
jgi:hypothetical protein